MKLTIFRLSAVLAATVLVSCDKPAKSTENDELKQRIEQLEKEKENASEQERAATEQELAKARAELALALDALEEEKANPVPVPAPGAKVNVKDAGKAVVVDESVEQERRVALELAEREGREARRLSLRRALEEKVAEEAMLRERAVREEAARRALAERCQPSGHQQLEEAYHVSQAQYEAALGRLNTPGLDARQRGFAQLAMKKAEESFLATEAGYVAHMKQFHGAEWARLEAERRAEEERRRRMACQPSEHERLETALARAQREAAEATKAMEIKNPSARQAANARLRLAEANRILASADDAFMAHLRKHHPEDHARALAERARWEEEQAKLEERRKRDALARERAAREAEEARRLAEASARAEAARQAEMQARARVEAALRAEEERRRQAVCRPNEHQALEAAYKAALAEWEAATLTLNKPHLNPKQLVFARKIAGAATRKLDGAKNAYVAHLQQHHPEDLRRMEREQAQAEAQREAEEKARALSELQKREAESARAAAEVKAKAELLAREKQRLLEVARVEAERAKAAEMARAAEVAKAAEAAAEAERRAREEAAKRTPVPAPAPAPAPAGCAADVHQQLEAGLKGAKEATLSVKTKLETGRLNPRQAAYARLSLSNLVKKEASAQAAYDAHLQEHHPAEWKQIEAERAAAAKAAAEKEKRGNQ